MTNSAARQVMTVLGPIPAGRLGVTLCHEHLVGHPNAELSAADPDVVLDDLDKAVSELSELGAAGGDAIIDMTTHGYGRDVAAIVHCARVTGMHVVMTTGVHKYDHIPESERDRSVDEICAAMVRDVIEGIDGHRCGVIKAGTSMDQLHPEERRGLLAAGAASRETGAPVATHSEGGRFTLDQVDLIEEGGADLSRVMIGHLDGRHTLDELVRIADRGVWLGFDSWSKQRYGPDEDRASAIRELVDRGFTQIVVSGDVARRSMLRSWGGSPGFAGVLGLIRQHIADPELERMLLVDNPARLYSTAVVG